MSRLLALIAVFSFNIPAGDAVRTLDEWATQAKASTLWNYADIQRRRLKTPAVKGLLTQQESLCLLLKGTGLTFSVVASEHGSDQPTYTIVPEGSGNADDERVTEPYNRVCEQPEGLGPGSIKVPEAEWRI